MWMYGVATFFLYYTCILILSFGCVLAGKVCGMMGMMVGSCGGEWFGEIVQVKNL